MKKIKKITVLFLIILSLQLSAVSAQSQLSGTYKEALRLYEKGDYNAAQTKLIKEIKTNPKNREAKYYLAETLFNKKLYKDAAYSYTIVNWGIHKTHFEDAHFKKLLCYYYLKDYKAANMVGYTELLSHKERLKDKKKLIIIYTILGDSELHVNHKNNAISHFKKVLTYNNSYQINKQLGLIYFQDKDYDEALYYLLQADKIEKHANTLKMIAEIYAYKNDEKLAMEYFIESTKMMPDDYEGLLNSLVGQIFIQTRTMLLQEPIINISENKAPQKIHKLIHTEGFPNKKNTKKLHDLIDLLWNDTEGQILLNRIYNHNIPIILSTDASYSNINAPDLNITIADNVGEIPLSYLVPDNWNYLKVTIRESDIKDNKNSNLVNNKNLYLPLTILVHELCHAAYRTKSYSSSSTLEEEFLCSMIGSNIAHRVLYKRPLNNSEIVNQAMFYKINTDNQYSYKKLKRNDEDFIPKMDLIGIKPPNYELYSNYYTEYSKTEKELQDITPLITKYMNKDEISNNKIPKYNFLIDRNGNIINPILIKSSGDPKYDEKSLECIKKASPLPQEILPSMNLAIPVFFSFGNDNKVTKQSYQYASKKKKQGILSRKDDNAEPDFKPYIKALWKKMEPNWLPPSNSEDKGVTAIFVVSRNGDVSEIRIKTTSGNKAIDEAAIKAVKLSAPFLPLPEEYKGEKVNIEFYFDCSTSNKKNK